MGKSNKPTKWFKAVKKAFRSPSKEKPAAQDDTKYTTDEKVLSSHDFSPASHQVPTPHPLPSFETPIFEEVAPDQTQRQPLPTQEVADPAISVVDFPDEEEEVEEEEVLGSNNGVQSDEKHHDDNDDSYVSEEVEAAIRIQQRFASPLALRGLIRLQALVRGHRVRRQAATTLRAMEALVRVQARVRGRLVRMSKEGQAVQNRIQRRRQYNARPSKPGGGRWDASRGTLQDKNAQTSSREEGARKRERAMAYAFSQQLKKSTPNRSTLYIDCEPNQPHWGWTWLQRWTMARPWENHQLEDSKDFFEIIPSQRNYGYTTKEVNASTLKVKNYGNFPSNPVSSKPISPSPPLEKGESQFTVPQQQNVTRVPKSLPVRLPFPPTGSSTSTQSHPAVSKPPPIEVPSYAAVEEDEDTRPEPRTPEGQKSPGTENSLSVPPSPALSDSSLPVPPSPQASDASLPVPDTPPGMGSAEVDRPETMEALVLPEAHEDNGGETNGSMLSQNAGFLAAHGVYEHGEDSPSLNKESSSDALNAHACSGHLETGHSNPRNGEKAGENGDSPLPATSLKPTTCRYMAATESAKAKFRSASNPKTRSPVTAESPVRLLKRYSLGGAQMGKTDSPKTTLRASSFQIRGSQSPKTRLLREKPQLEAGAESPARRISYGGAEGKGGIRWRS